MCTTMVGITVILMGILLTMVPLLTTTTLITEMAFGGICRLGGVMAMTLIGEVVTTEAITDIDLMVITLITTITGIILITGMGDTTIPTTVGTTILTTTVGTMIMAITGLSITLTTITIRDIRLQ